MSTNIIRQEKWNRLYATVNAILTARNPKRKVDSTDRREEKWLLMNGSSTPFNNNWKLRRSKSRVKSKAAKQARKINR